MSNRGNSNKNLIRNGETTASVEIELYNKGEDGYRRDVYGDLITIVRTVTTAGSGGYKLKNDRGRIVQDKKVREELDRILDCFTIQVDNPIAVSLSNPLLFFFKILNCS